jgi:uncharacterized phage infection (PIP) family protein YhgE
MEMSVPKLFLDNTLQFLKKKHQTLRYRIQQGQKIVNMKAYKYTQPPIAAFGSR